MTKLIPPAGFCQSEIENTIIVNPPTCPHDGGTIISLSPNILIDNFTSLQKSFANPLGITGLFVNAKVCTERTVAGLIVLSNQAPPMPTNFNLRYFINELSMPVTNEMALNNSMSVATIQAIINANIIVAGVVIIVQNFVNNILDVIIQVPINFSYTYTTGEVKQGMETTDVTSTFVCSAQKNGGGLWAVLPQTGTLSEEAYQKRGKPNFIIEQGVKYEFHHKNKDGKYVYVKVLPVPFTGNSYPSPLF